MKRTIKLADEKYTVTLDGAKLSAARYGEPWREMTGDHLVYHLFQAALVSAAMEQACEELPFGWLVELCLEQGALSVTLIDPEGALQDEDEFCSPDDALPEKIFAAIAYAKSKGGAQ